MFRGIEGKKSCNYTYLGGKLTEMIFPPNWNDQAWLIQCHVGKQHCACVLDVDHKSTIYTSDIYWYFIIKNCSLFFSRQFRYWRYNLVKTIDCENLGYFLLRILWHHADKHHAHVCKQMLLSANPPIFYIILFFQA